MSTSTPSNVKPVAPMVASFVAHFLGDDKITLDDGRIAQIPSSASKRAVETVAGIDAETQKQVHDADSNMVDAAATIAAQYLEEDVKKAKAAGKDVAGLKSQVKINVGNDNFRLTVSAKNSGPVPNKPGETYTNFGSISVGLHRGSVAKPVATQIAESMKALVEA